MENKKYLDITPNKNRLYNYLVYELSITNSITIFRAINKSVQKLIHSKKKKEISKRPELINRLTNIRKKWDYNKRDIKKNYITKQLISELKSFF